MSENQRLLAIQHSSPVMILRPQQNITLRSDKKVNGEGHGGGRDCKARGRESDASSRGTTILESGWAVRAQNLVLQEGVRLQANADTISEPLGATPSKRAVSPDADAMPRANPQAAVENAYLSRARALVQACVDAGAEDIDLS
jgi:hypothetical protein